MTSLTQSFVSRLTTDTDPFPIFKFWVEIDSIVVAQFQECSGLRMERSVEPIEEGGVNDHVHILPGHNKYFNIVLKNGMLYTTELWDWYQVGLWDAKVKRINFSILLRDLAGTVAKRWNIIDGFPVKWDGPQLTADSQQIAVETIEIAHHGITMG